MAILMATNTGHKTMALRMAILANNNGNNNGNHGNANGHNGNDNGH